MYHDEFFPFYAVYADPEVYDRERRQERELQLMNSWYPQNARELRDHIREECDLLDYQGSRIYDEYPDPWMLRRDYQQVRDALQERKEVPEELFQVLFWQEISERRCRRQPCQGDGTTDAESWTAALTMALRTP